MPSNLYGVFLNRSTTNNDHKQKWGIGRNKRRAIAFAKRNGAQVRVQHGAGSAGGPLSYDATTFHYLSEPVGHYFIRQGAD